MRNPTSIELLLCHRTAQEAATGAVWTSFSVVELARVPLRGECVELGRRWYRVDLVCQSTRSLLRSEVFATEVDREEILAAFVNGKPLAV